MTEHLPECPMRPSGAIYCSIYCICDALRACEKRAREEERSNNFTPDDHADGMTEAYQRGLNAALEAVKGVNWFNDEGKMLSAIVATADSIAAIDALKKARDD